LGAAPQAFDRRTGGHVLVFEALGYRASRYRLQEKRNLKQAHFISAMNGQVFMRQMDKIYSHHP